MIDTVAGEVKVLVRVAPDVHAALKEIAAAEDRSLNMQINRALRQWLQQQRADPEKADNADGSDAER